MKYLYGAAVQGIQEFIFQTNKLSEITGASELVERICTDYFKETVGNVYNEENAIVRAAGNVKYLFDTAKECQTVVRRFPKEVIQKVPGVTISQAVLKIAGDNPTPSDYIELESRLRIQRNKASRPTTLGLMGIERSRQTGLPAVNDKDQDEGTLKKKGILENTKKNLCEKAFGIGDSQLVEYQTDQLTGDNDWIAVIHADGNGLGQVLQKIANGNDKNAFRKFSQDLDNANRAAAQDAYISIRDKEKFDKRIPIRPIVLSGDDFTVICRADFAIELTQKFIQNFEDNTRKMGHSLRACAGIVFVKSSFPFYYAYEMAEDLCNAAKEDAKKKVKNQWDAPSCMMFYKVEDSFTESYNEIKDRVLTTKDGFSYAFGPYYLDNSYDNRWTIETLLKTVETLNKEDKESNALKSHIRQWLSIRFNNPGEAQQKLDRMKTTLDGQTTTINRLTTPVEDEDAPRKMRIPAYDVLSLHSVMYNKTK